MRKSFFIALFTIAFCLNAYAQSCLPNGISFYSQAEIDGFSVNYPGCTTIEGNISISGSGITNLNGLSGITAVGGYVYIQAINLTSLNGMQNIKSIKGITLYQTGLTSLNGLQGLISLEFLQIGYINWSLTSLSGMPNITSLKRLSIAYSGLTSLNGLQNLTSLEELEVQNNPWLTSLSGMPNVHALKSLTFYENVALTSLNGLQGLTSLDNLTVYYGSTSLASLNGLQNVTSMKRILIQNSGLSDLTGLQNLSSLEYLELAYNASLSSLNGLQSLNTLLGLTLYDNSTLSNLNGLQNFNTIKTLSLNSNAMLSNISSLANLSVIDNLYIYGNNALTTLNGLGNIHTLNTLNIEHNAVLSNLSGIQNITSVGSLSIASPIWTNLTSFQNMTVNKSLTVHASPLLSNLNGLSNISALGWLSIYSNDGLTSLSGLNNLVALDTLSISYNPVLTNIGVLQQINTMKGIWMQGNPALTSISGLQQLTSLQELHLSYSALTNLDGLQNIGSLQVLDMEVNPELTSLYGLDNITAIGTIRLSSSPLLTSLNTLQKVVSLGSLHVSYTGLVNFDGMQKVTTLESLNISNNSLLSLSGLENVTSIGGQVSITGNSVLPNLIGLDKLSTIEGAVWVASNAALADFSGLGSLISIGTSMQIENNPALLNLNGLEQLVNIGSTGTSSLFDTLNGALQIYSNQSLTSLGGLNKVTSIKSISAFGNPLLSDCSVFAVCNLLFNAPQDVFIGGNATDCNTREEIEALCNSIPVVARVLIDNNANCQADAGDTPAADVQVRLSGTVQMSLRPSNTDGVARFSFFENGLFNLGLPQFPTDHWAVCQDPIQLNPNGSTDTIRTSFLLSALTQCPELTVQLGMPSFFRGCLVSTDLEVVTQNTGAIPAQGVKVAIVLPPVLELLASAPPFDAQSGDTLFFDMGDLPTFGKANVMLTVRTKCDTFVLGQTLCIETFAAMDNACPTTTPPFSEIKLSAKCINGNTVRFTVKNIGDAPTQGWHEYRIIRNNAIQYNNGFSLAAQQSLSFDFPADGATWRMEATKFDDGTETAVALENCNGLTSGLINAFWLDYGPLEYDFDCRQVIGSFDPNQKTAVPTGAGSSHNILANQPIQYTIDFQNTGSDTAYRVLLRDVLSSNFDLNTFRPGYASHPCTWQIKGSTLEVLFSPIALPDSNVNEPASHGFFSFNIDQKPNLPQGTYFENTADIIFDFNPPIYTNYVYHQIGKLTVKVDEPQLHAALWQVLGNPTRDVATFQAMEEIAGEKQFDLYDAAGRLVRSAQFSGQVFEFQRDMLEAGVYFFRIVEEKGRVFTGKIVVTD